MNKIRALLIAICITALIAVLYRGFFHSDSIREKALVMRVIDGDTLELSDARRIRLLNINTPEKKEPFSTLGPDYLSQFVNRTVELEITGTEKYGRLLARVYGPEYVNLELVRKGFATSFLVDENEQALFKNAQKEAFDKNRGLWQKSPFYGCMDVEINKKEEFLTIEQQCGTLYRWILKDESTKKYSFSGSEPASFTLYSGKGTSAGSDYYWGQAGHVWNDDKDSIFVRDNNGLLVFYSQYGY